MHKQKITRVEKKLSDGYRGKNEKYRELFKDWSTWRVYSSLELAQERLPELMEQHQHLQFRIKPDD